MVFSSLYIGTIKEYFGPTVNSSSEFVLLMTAQEMPMLSILIFTTKNRKATTAIAQLVQQVVNEHTDIINWCMTPPW